MSLTYQRAAMLLIFTAVLMLACGVNPEDYDAGVQAYSRGDYKTAFAKWRPLAKHGRADAETYLGVLYYQGQGVPQDYNEAIKWYKAAAAQGYGDAMYNLGIAYAEGKGMNKDPQQALRWYRMAGGAGSIRADNLLGEIYTKGTVGVPVDLVEAAKWYLAAADQGSAEAQLKVAGFYAKGGKGLPVDAVKAHMWYYIASTSNDDRVRAAAQRAEEGAGGEEGIQTDQDEMDIAEGEREAQDWIKQFHERTGDQQ